MDEKPIEPNTLRTKAEVIEAQLSPEPADEVLHELRVHQIELEMQNEELRRIHVALEESRDRYLDLYDFAPVGYLTLTREGFIAEINLTAASLLGIDRRKLLKLRFASFVTPKENDRWYLFFTSMIKRNKRQNIELTLKRGDGGVFPVQLDCLCATSADTEPCCELRLPT